MVINSYLSCLTYVLCSIIMWSPDYIYVPMHNNYLVSYYVPMQYIITVWYATTSSSALIECYNVKFYQYNQHATKRRSNTIGRRSTRVHMTCRAFPL